MYSITASGPIKSRRNSLKAAASTSEMRKHSIRRLVGSDKPCVWLFRSKPSIRLEGDQARRDYASRTAVEQGRAVCRLAGDHAGVRSGLRAANRGEAAGGPFRGDGYAGDARNVGADDGATDRRARDAEDVHRAADGFGHAWARGAGERRA